MPSILTSDGNGDDSLLLDLFVIPEISFACAVSGGFATSTPLVASMARPPQLSGPGASTENSTESSSHMKKQMIIASVHSNM